MLKYSDLVILHSLLVVVLLSHSAVGNNNIADPCSDPTLRSYNETHASRTWHGVASSLSLPHKANFLTFTEKNGCIKLRLELFSVNQALGSLDPTIEIQLRCQLEDLCSATPEHYSLRIDDKSHTKQVLTIASFDIKNVSLVPLSMTGSFKNTTYSGQFKLQMSAMSFSSNEEPYDTHDFHYNNKVEGTECTLQGHFKDAQGTVYSTDQTDLVVSWHDGRTFVFSMKEQISATAALAENTVQFQHCPCDVKSLQTAQKKRCNPYNL